MGTPVPLAATAAVMWKESIVRCFEMRVVRPFALAVRHRGTGAVLCTAWVGDPDRGRRRGCP